MALNKNFLFQKNKSKNLKKILQGLIFFPFSYLINTISPMFIVIALSKLLKTPKV